MGSPLLEQVVEQIRDAGFQKVMMAVNYRREVIQEHFGDGSAFGIDIGYIHDSQGDWKTAITFYNRAIRSDPMKPEAYIDLGYDYNEHRLFPLAEAAYIKGLAVAQDDGRLHYMLAVTYNLQGKIALARDQYRHAIASEEPIVVRAAQAELALLPAP